MNRTRNLSSIIFFSTGSFVLFSTLIIFVCFKKNGDILDAKSIYPVRNTISAVEEASSGILERQEQIFREIKLKLNYLSDQVMSIKNNVNNLSSMTPPVSSNATIDSSTIPKPRVRSGENQAELVSKCLKITY